MRRLWIFFILFFAGGCFQKREIQLPEILPKPLVVSLFNDDTTFIIKLSLLSPINDTLNQPVDNASCKIISNGQTINLNYIGQGFYVSKQKPQPEVNYLLKIFVPGFDTLVASSYIPQKVNLLKVTQQDFAIPDNTTIFEDDLHLPFSRLSFMFKDPEDEKNYYEIQIYLKFYDNIFNDVRLYSLDPWITAEDILDYEPRILVFSDSLFNGDTVTVNVLYKPNSIMYDGYEYTYGSYLILYRFRTISRQMYLYKKSLIRHLYNQQTDYIEAFGDPVQLYSNIINGYGIFAGYTQVEDTIRVEPQYFEP